MTIEPEHFLLALVVAVLLYAALSDIFRRQIPNRVSLALIGLFGAALLLSGVPDDLLVHLACAAGVFAAGFALWTRGVLGGGDVKLLAAMALWADAGTIGGFLLLTALAGGVLAAVHLVLARARPFIEFFWLQMRALAAPVRAGIDLRCARQSLDALSSWAGPVDGPKAPEGIPYGVAIAAAGIWLVLHSSFVIG
ncbi:MAG: prepilin peptidase [Geminicoccaceae bacterium]|nr:prepilin peptidase [Geminicoccaceae bacterium]